MLQALASRIAVLENRHALDAIRKARLFLHGRMLHALKLTVAAFVGTLVVVVAGSVVHRRHSRCCSLRQAGRSDGPLPLALGHR